MAWSKEDKAELANVLKEALRDASRGMTRTSPGTRRKPHEVTYEYEKALSEKFKNTAEEVEDLGKLIGKLQETTKDLLDENGNVIERNKKYSQIVQRINKSVLKSSEIFDKLNTEVNVLQRKSYADQRDYLARYSQSIKSLNTELGKSVRASSLFGASLIDSLGVIEGGTEEYYEMVEDLKNASKPLNQGLLKAAGVWDEKTKTVKEGLTPDTFSKLRISIGEAQTSIAESLGGMDLKNIGELLAKGDDTLEEMFKSSGQVSAANRKVKDQILKLATQLERQGFDVGAGIVIKSGADAGKINPAAIERLSSNESSKELIEILKNLQKISEQNAEFMGRTSDVAAQAQTHLGKFNWGLRANVKELGGFKGTLMTVGKAIAGTTAGAAGFVGLKNAVKDVIGQLADFNIAHVPKSFMDTNTASIKLGMSFQDTVRFMQENKRTMAIFGDGFDQVTDQLRGTFGKFGFNMQQASEVIGPATEAAASSLVNIRKKDALNNFIDESMKSFQKVAGIVNISAAKYMEMNAELLGSEDIQKTLLGLDQATAQARAKEIIALRDHYIALGLSTEQAQALVKAQEAQQREAVVSRVREGAKAMLLAGQMGFSSEEQMRMFNLIRKGRKSEPEKQELAEMLGRLGVSTEQRVTSAYGADEASGEVAQTLAERLMPGGEVGRIVAASMEAEQKRLAGQDISDAERDASAAKAAGSEAVADISQKANQISAIIENQFGKSLLAGTASMVGLSISALRASRSLGMLGGRGAAGLMGKMSGKMGGLAGKFRSILGFGGRAAATTAAGAATSVAGNVVAKTVAKEGGEAIAKTGAKAAGKSVLKKIPIIGALAGLGFMAQRAFKGDFAGAGLELASGLASTIPGVGTAASIAIDAGLAARDIHKASQATMGTPTDINPPSVGQPVKSEPGAGVNKNSSTSASVDKEPSVLEVQDETAHDHLSTIADGMLRAVALLQAMADRGDQAALNALNEKMKNKGIRPIPTANSFITGRQVTTP